MRLDQRRSVRAARRVDAALSGVVEKEERGRGNLSALAVPVPYGVPAPVPYWRRMPAPTRIHPPPARSPPHMHNTHTATQVQPHTPLARLGSVLGLVLQSVEVFPLPSAVCVWACVCPCVEPAAPPPPAAVAQHHTPPSPPLNQRSPHATSLLLFRPFPFPFPADAPRRCCISAASRSSSGGIATHLRRPRGLLGLAVVDASALGFGLVVVASRFGLAVGVSAVVVPTSGLGSWFASELALVMFGTDAFIPAEGGEVAVSIVAEATVSTVAEGVLPIVAESSAPAGRTTPASVPDFDPSSLAFGRLGGVDSTFAGGEACTDDNFAFADSPFASD
ncbi:hypothetical protein C8J57DRAFT_1620089 [Mycena rebaudengoi]|nr:hypothetical protein C8J57DRAFT_1620089 [Mycena rebaudengoi]